VSAVIFRPANALEESLLAALRAHDRDALLGAIASGELLLPAPEAPPRGERLVVAGEGAELPLAFLEHEGTRYVAAFTSPAQFLRFLPNGSAYIRLRGAALAAVAPPEHALVLNPGGDIGVTLTPDEIAALRTASRGLSRGFAIGEPKQEAAELLDALTAFAEETPAVVAAYRALLVHAPDGTEELAVGFELGEGADESAVLAGAAERARAVGNETVGYVALVDGRPTEPVGTFLHERTTPFYKRR
jgi:type III secretion system (T3SS) SseB-like protein